MPGWRKMESVSEMRRTVRSLALVGLRERHPEVAEESTRSGPFDPGDAATRFAPDLDPVTLTRWGGFSA